MDADLSEYMFVHGSVYRGCVDLLDGWKGRCGEMMRGWEDRNLTLRGKRGLEGWSCVFAVVDERVLCGVCALSCDAEPGAGATLSS
jgi:hypothetical protein